MEQRTIIAITLSLLVLFVYSSLTQKSGSRASNFTQVIDNKEVKYISNSVKVDAETIIVPPSLPIPTEDIQEIASKEINVEFSNVGGSIRKVVIKSFSNTLPIKAMLNIPGFENEKFEETGKGKDWIEYSLRTNQLTIVKRYSLPENDHIINAQITVKDINDLSKLENLKIDGMLIDMSSVDKNKIMSEGTLYEYSASINSNLGGPRKS